MSIDSISEQQQNTPNQHSTSVLALFPSSMLPCAHEVKYISPPAQVDSQNYTVHKNTWLGGFEQLIGSFSPCSAQHSAKSSILFW